MKKSVPQRNFVAKYSRVLNKAHQELSKKDKLRHKKTKHKLKEV